MIGVDAATMPAFVLGAPGERPRVERFPVPEDDPSARAVEVHAAGLNPFDVVYAAGAHAIGPPPTPSVVGIEGIGRTADGRRVYFDVAVAPYGSLAPYAAVAPEHLFDVRADVDDATAIALGAAGFAAWIPLMRRACVTPTDTVAVLGATGAVGRLAVQLARLAGARRVVAVGRDVETLRRSAREGADAVVALGEGGDLAASIHAATEGRLDVVIDLLWGAPARAALEACSVGARFVQVGSSAATEAVLPANSWRTRWVSLLGYSTLHASAADKADAYAALLDHAAAGRLAVGTRVLPFSAVDEAWSLLASGSREKLVVRMREP